VGTLQSLPYYLAVRKADVQESEAFGMENNPKLCSSAVMHELCREKLIHLLM
jgi:hypothetical protein